eukprot:6469091-Amphidinium_carterae.1
MAAVCGNGSALQFAAEVLQRDSRIVMAAVSQNGAALQHAQAELKHNYAIVLAAVSNCGLALQFAAAELRANSHIVRAAVSQCGAALEFAAMELRSDPGTVKRAVLNDSHALLHAADPLLGDDTFAVYARRELFIFKISTLSGRSCIVAFSSARFPSTAEIIHMSCKKLGWRSTGSETLLDGLDVVPHHIFMGVCDIGRGKVVEYQLVR